ncbi:MAG: leucyl aminopeptidase family protein [Saprospirales bacterium]|nr:leucyl aminopeptidase family protein [Saprospirales bacterium]
MLVEIKTQITSDSADTLLIPCWKNQPFPQEVRQWFTSTGVSPEQLTQDFCGDLKETSCFYLPWDGKNRKIYLVGLGESPGFSQVLHALRSFTHRNRSKLPSCIGLYLKHLAEDGPSLRHLEATLNGMLLARYQLGMYKTDDNKLAPFQQENAQIQVFLSENLVAKAQVVAHRVQQVAATQLEIFDLVNKPSYYITPQALATWAEEAGKIRGFQVKVLDKPTLEKEGFHALLAVNRASIDPAVFITMDYQPPDREPVATVCLVGKGVTFDVGGLSIKPSSNMHYMKSDMGGAAAVLGAVDIAAKLQLPIRVIGLIPSTDNSVDALALKPNEVISSYSGKTIEIIDTDAEGRLILADGLSYAVRNYQSDVLIDLATLTGSTIRTLGYAAGGLFTNNDQLAKDLLDAGDTCGERLWRLPIWDEFKDGIKSDIADVKNFSSKPTAGAIYAAKFLEVFIDNHPSWAHLDIAGVAITDSEFGTQKTATAYGVRLLLDYFEALIQHKSQA